MTDTESSRPWADKMDEAASAASQELDGLATKLDVAKWVSKHYRTAGYTRLCRLLRALVE